jgi:hypothetical protein
MPRAFSQSVFSVKPYTRSDFYIKKLLSTIAGFVHATHPWAARTLFLGLLLRGLKLVCNVIIVYGKLKSESSQDYAQKPQRNYIFMISASGALLL